MTNENRWFHVRILQAEAEARAMETKPKEVIIPFEDELDNFSATVRRHWGHRTKAMITTVAIELHDQTSSHCRWLSIMDAERVRDTLNAAISKAKELETEEKLV